MMSRTVLIALLVVLTGGSVCLIAAGGPNIVLIMADDMGYGDVRTLNPDSAIPTPSIDSLAADGMAFTDAHTPSAICTPTRYGLMTGRYCWRSRLKKGVLKGYGRPLIERDRLTVAGFLKQQGYYTGIVGKWHLGLGFGRKGDEFDFHAPVTDNPNTHGFDYSFIIPASLDFPPYVFVNDGKITAYPSIEQPAQKFPAFLRKGPRSPDLIMVRCLDDLVRRAQRYIRRRANKDQPFFLYFPLTAPHKPALPALRFRGVTNLGPYGDFVYQVDWSVGQILKTIRDAGVEDNTLVICTSDNGSYMFRYDDPKAPDHVSDPSIQGYRPDHHRANYVFRGTKADIWEAGHHVPFFARWPGKIKPGSKNSQTICLTDFFATVAEISGAELPDDAAQDSFSLLPLLLGEGTVARAPVIHHSGAGMFAIRDGRWKLVAGNGSGGREKPKGKPFGRPYKLFDMTNDTSERHDVIDSHPDIVSRLEAELEKIRASGRSR